ncbi:MAG TPA: hypothetical protein PLK90_04110 [Clostridiales bacterium]|nr:hypothetical protein [Clostridiales bacterium]HQP69565.1 hypothetical protein [Clostridiales bacterium]
MYKKSTALFLIIVALVSAKVNVGFYSLSQTSGDFQNKWIGYAMTDIIADKLSNVSQINIIKDDQIYDYLVSKGTGAFLNTASKSSFEGDIRDHFNLDYLVTGNYSVNPDNSLPVNITVYSLKDSVEVPPIVIQGFANDLHTIVSYITHPICSGMKLNLSMEEIQAVKQLDLTTKRTGTANIYKGKISFRNKDYKGATDFFEEAYKEDPSNNAAKINFDKALAYFYGEGIFALNLLETDLSETTPFRKQYMITRKISKSYTSELLSTKLLPKNGGTHYDIDLALRLTLTPEANFMTEELIKKFSTGGAGETLDDGVYNPNADKVLDEREIFENNVGNFQIVMKLVDKDGKVLQQTSQPFRTAFGMTYPGAVKDRVFKNNSAETTLAFYSVSRDIVRNTTKVLITVE